jgi:hypothetical protein
MTRLACLLLLACGPVDVVVANVPPGSPPRDCYGPGDCMSGEFCEYLYCADTSGKCRLEPLSCDGAPMFPVCGCDGKQYPSDCARQQAAVSRGNGPC